MCLQFKEYVKIWFQADEFNLLGRTVLLYLFIGAPLMAKTASQRSSSACNKIFIEFGSLINFHD